MINTTINILEIMENKDVLLDYLSNTLLFDEGNIYDINSAHLRSIKDHLIKISKTNHTLTSYNLSHEFEWLTMSEAKYAIDNLKTLIFLTRKHSNLKLNV